MDKPLKNQDELTEKETARRRDEIAKRMLETPPKSHKEVSNESPKQNNSPRRQGAGRKRKD